MHVEYNKPLAEYTTFQLGGSVSKIIHCTTPSELIETVRKIIEEHKPYILIGGGSNIVASDSDMDLTVIRYVSDTPLIKQNENVLTVSASTSFDALALYCVDVGLTGLNTCHGIPGTVGGAIVGNAGAFGKQIGDIVTKITVLDPKGELKTLAADNLGFSYRHSELKNSKYIVVDATLELTPDNPISLAQQRAEILKQRWEKHPNLKTHPCAGSFFRNIEPTSNADRRQAAGWFLEEADGKNLSSGGANIFEKHANIIVKGYGCSAQDVHDLHLKMKKVVKEKFNLDLVREVRFMGPFSSEEKINPNGFW